MKKTIFLSSVTSEFSQVRNRLCERLNALRGIAVCSEENLSTSFESPLEGLRTIIEKVEAVIHVIENTEGFRPPQLDAEKLVQQLPGFSTRLPEVSARALLGEITYTEWEAWLAVYFNKTVCCIQTNCMISQTKHKHVDLLRQYGIVPSFVEDGDAFCKEVLNALQSLKIVYVSGSMLTDEVDIERVIAGDSDEVNKFCELSMPMLTQMARRFSTSTYDCEDIVLDVLADVFRNIDKFSGQSFHMLRMYMIKALRMRCLDHARKKSVSQRCARLEEELEPSYLMYDDHERTGGLLEKVMMDLEDRDRRILVMILAGLSTEEMSNQLGCSLRTVYVLIKRAKDAARRVIEKSGAE